MILSLIRSLGIVASICLLSPALIHAGSIFDDDWTPPKPIGAPQAAPESPTKGSTLRPSGTQPVSQPPRANPTGAQAGGDQAPRRPIPAGPEQARSRKLLKAAFADQLKDRSIQGRKKLAAALLDQVAKTEDNASDEFVLLGGAIDASKEGGDLGLCFKAADVMASQYQVDGLSIKADAVLKMDFRGGSPDDAAENVRKALDLIDPLLRGDDFRGAQRVIAQARQAARNVELTALVQQRGKAIDALRVAHDRAQTAAEKLKSAPDDPAANLAVGIYLCFGKEDWAKGLPLLAKSSDTNVKQLAALEIARPDKPDDLIRVGDGWWDAAVRQPESDRAAIRHHAASFYKAALESATGLQRSVLEHRIAEASAARRQLAAGSDEISVKKFVGEFLDDDRGPFFKTDSPEVPDVLSVAVDSGKVHVFGIKKVKRDAPAVLGRPSGWLGKAVLFRLPEARGTITVSAVDAGAAYRYYIMFVDKKGRTRYSMPNLSVGTSYMWSVSRTDAEVKFTVSAGDETVGSVTTPIADVYSFGFATTMRTGGSHLDMEITIGDPSE